MEQTIKSGGTSVAKGTVAILIAVGVGLGSGYGLMHLMPKNTDDELSAAEQTQQDEAAKAGGGAGAEAGGEAGGAASETAAAPAEAPASTETADAGTAAPAEGSAPSAEAAPAESSAPAESAAAPAEAAPSEPAPTETAAAEPAPEPAAPAEAAPAAEPAPAPEPAPAAAPAKPKSGSSSAASGNSKPRKAVRKLPPPAAEVLRPWWQATDGSKSGVQYVGQVDGQRSVAVLFADSASTSKSLKLLDKDGKEVSGSWQNGKNPLLKVFPNVKRGRYTLQVDQMRGPVFIQ